MKTVTKEAIIPQHYITYAIPVVIEQCNYPYEDLGIKYFHFTEDYYKVSAKTFDSHIVAIFRVKPKLPMVVTAKGELETINAF